MVPDTRKFSLFTFDELLALESALEVFIRRDSEKRSLAEIVLIELRSYISGL